MKKKKSKGRVLQKFTPTAKMKQWLSSAFELGYGANLTEVAEKAKVSRQSWYDWIENDVFVKWWDKMWQKHLLGMRWRLDAIGMERAEKDYTYWKDMMRRVGNLPEEQAVSAQVNIFSRLGKEDKEFVEGEEVEK